MRLLFLAALFIGATGCPERIPEKPVDLASHSPQILRFTAKPQVVQQGAQVMLSWNARNASYVLLEQAVESRAGAPADPLRSLGKFAVSGTLYVSPKASTTYVLSCGEEDSPIGCVAASVRVVVR